MPTRLPATSLTKHTIDVQGHQPIKQCHSRLSPKVEEAFREAAQKLEDEGIISPNGSEWCNPIVMVRKSDGGHRLCIDFRKLNEVAKKDAYPMKNISEILDKLSSAKYISKIDLSQAFHQIPLAEESKELTAFPVPGKGLFHYNRMPFGLSGAKARFQRLLDRLITPEFEPHAFAYLDDIIIVSETFKEHTYWLEKVLDAILKAGLTVNREKSEFGCSQVRYLGYLVDRTGMHPDPEKVEPITSYPAPNTLRKLRRFLGMVSWYRRFIKDFAAKAEPLYRLLKKNRRYTWENEQEQAFQELKNALITARTLSRPDFSLPFVLQTDASSTGLGAVLTQVQNGEEHVIAFASRSMQGAEKNYTVTEQECLAVIWAVEKFRP